MLRWSTSSRRGRGLSTCYDAEKLLQLGFWATLNLRQIFTSFISSERYGTHFPRNFRLFELRTRRCRAIYLSNTFSVSSQPASDNPRSKIVSHGFIRKILSLYQRVLRRYRGNVRLWLEFTTFCYSHGSRHLVSEVISQALQLNPTCAGLWSFAAHWEYKRKVCLNFLFIISCLSTERLYDLDIIRAISPQHDNWSCAACETAIRAKVWSPTFLAITGLSWQFFNYFLSHTQCCGKLTFVLNWCVLMPCVLAVKFFLGMNNKMINIRTKETWQKLFLTVLCARTQVSRFQVVRPTLLSPLSSCFS